MTAITLTALLADERYEGKMEGLAEGKAEGLAEGKAEMSLGIVSYMLSQGRKADEISSIIGLPLDDVLALAAKSQQELTVPIILAPSVTMLENRS